ncbi:hypothetical protein OBBRIDRAFT_578928 [Obba rivulosa]|uniref:Uncharacterized protein n=1 Tax=Obba rivulosa TaxID=1052685 RepID=A0A8E2DTJ6_9APHY|nr:hypothetical protein OBBRIDRAFT_578928 [Obba rivulosa]
MTLLSVMHTQPHAFVSKLHACKSLGPYSGPIVSTIHDFDRDCSSQSHSSENVCPFSYHDTTTGLSDVSCGCYSVLPVRAVADVPSARRPASTSSSAPTGLQQPTRDGRESPRPQFSNAQLKPRTNSETNRSVSRLSSSWSSRTVLATVTNRDPTVAEQRSSPLLASYDWTSCHDHGQESLRTNRHGREARSRDAELPQWTELEDDLVRSYHDLPRTPPSISCITLYETSVTVPTKYATSLCASADESGDKETALAPAVRWLVSTTPGRLTSTEDERRRLVAAVELERSLVMQQCSQLQDEYCRKRYKEGRQLPNGYVVSLLNPCWSDLECPWRLHATSKQVVKRGKSYDRCLSDLRDQKDVWKHLPEIPLRIALLKQALYLLCNTCVEKKSSSVSASNTEDGLQ